MSSVANNNQLFLNWMRHSIKYQFVKLAVMFIDEKTRIFRTTWFLNRASWGAKMIETKVGKGIFSVKFCSELNFQPNRKRNDFGVSVCKRVENNWKPQMINSERFQLQSHIRVQKNWKMKKSQLDLFERHNLKPSQNLLQLIREQ